MGLRGCDFQEVTVGQFRTFVDGALRASAQSRSASDELLFELVQDLAMAWCTVAVPNAPSFSATAESARAMLR